METTAKRMVVGSTVTLDPTEIPFLGFEEIEQEDWVGKHFIVAAFPTLNWQGVSGIEIVDAADFTKNYIILDNGTARVV